MVKRIAVACMVGLLAAIVLPATYAQTPILGTARIDQNSSSFIDARFFDRDSSISDWEDNRTFSLGFSSPINEKTEFDLVYSDHRALGMIEEDVFQTDREVLSPAIKRLISATDKNPALAFSIGADVAINPGRWSDDSGEYIEADDFTVGAKLQLEWGQPGAMQYQIAAAVACFDSLMGVSYASPAAVTTADREVIDGFGTITSLGAGLVYPFSSFSFVGDFLIPVDGENVIKDEGYLDDVTVWSAGLRWGLGDRWGSSLNLYATNSMGPTLASSLLASPNNDIGYGITYSRGF